jgi:GPH family glycoside/pentoside/hexuronide:cation symporter
MSQNAVSMADRIPVREKIGYAMGDTAANFIFQTMIMFQLSFYTDTFGISATAAGILFLVVRFWDAIFDPIMGVIADHTNTRFGKFRPWVLWTALPFGIMGFLTFCTPNLGMQGKLIYAFVTYIALMMVYSMNNLPYSALSGVMTGNQGERTSLSSYRFVFAMIAQLLIQGAALPMVHFFGHGDNALGYRWTMGIFSSAAVLLFLCTFAATKERIQPPPGEKVPIRRNFEDLLLNKPWIVMFFVTIILFITLSMRGSVVIYYFQYYVKNESLFSAFNVLGTLSTILGIFFSKPLAMRFGKKAVFITGLLGTAFFCALFLFLPASSPKIFLDTQFPLFGHPVHLLLDQAAAVIFGCEMLRQFVYGFTIPLLWAMMADVADYSEWKFNRRATGVVFSAIVFGLKAGLGFGGALAAAVLAHFGYVPNAVQTPRALDGIRYTMSILPAITFALCGLTLLFYTIGKKEEKEISEDLAARRAKLEEAQA